MNETVGLVNEIEQCFMQPKGWDESKRLIEKTIAQARAEARQAALEEACEARPPDQLKFVEYDYERGYGQALIDYQLSIRRLMEQG